MANSNGWGDGAANNAIGWGQGANNNIGWGDSHAKSWAGATDIVGLTGDADATAFLTASAITGATQQAAIDTLVKGLKSDGLWSKMKAVYPFVTDNRNLLGYTEDFSNGLWQKSGATVTANNILAPDGTMTADRVVFGAVNNVIYQDSGLVGQYTTSFYVKGTAGETIMVFNGQTLVALTTLTGDWQRVTSTATTSGGSTHQPAVATFSGATARTIWVWGGQLDLGSTATTYQPIATTQQAYIASQFKYNLKDPRDLDAAFRLVFNGGWTHSSTGATPNGTNGYADTKLVPSSVLTQDSSHISGYTRTNTSVLAPLLSSENASTYANGIFIWPKYTGGIFSVRVNDDSSDSATAVTNTQGLHLATRTASNVKKYRHNTTQILSNTTASSALNVASIYIGASRNNANYSTHQTAFNTIGDGLTDTEATNLYTRVQAFQTSLSRQV